MQTGAAWEKAELKRLYALLESARGMTDEELTDLELAIESLEPLRLPPREPARSLPGTPQRVEEYRRRYMAGQAIFSPLDPTFHSLADGIGIRADGTPMRCKDWKPTRKEGTS